MPNETLEKVVSCSRLPSLPMVAVRVLELTRDPEVPIAKIAATVEHDQAMAAKILKTVNSSYYGLTKPCPSIARAVSYLGLNTVKSLVLSFSVIDTFRDADDEPPVVGAMWQRGVYGAAAARAIAKRHSSVDPDEAFLGGLLQDLGMLAMIAALQDEYLGLLRRAGRDHNQLPAAEEAEYGFDHAAVGAELGARWKLPSLINDAIGRHHAARPDGEAELVRIVRVATLASSVLCGSNDAAAAGAFRLAARGLLNLSDEEARDALELISSDGRELSSLFKTPPSRIGDVGDLMSRAADQLVEHQIAVDRERATLASTNQALSRRVITDALTGVYNRAHFDARLDESFADAVAARGALAAVFVDADHFKCVNDNYGHAAGDAVLHELARRISETVGGGGETFRYGGEEFAVLAPGLDRSAGGRLAERIRRAVEASPIDVAAAECDAESLPVTVSLGVAAVDPASANPFQTGFQLVAAADRALYAAKEAGRNCVRVYTPRPGGPDQRAAPGRTRRRSDPVPENHAARAHLMIVEDDPMHAKLIELAMASVGARLTCVGDAQAALDMLGSDGGGIALVLVDLQLPGRSGVELIREIRAAVQPATPILAISGRDDDQAVANALDGGADDFFSKSEMAKRPDELVERVIALMRRPEDVAA